MVQYPSLYTIVLLHSHRNPVQSNHRCSIIEWIESISTLDSTLFCSQQHANTIGLDDMIWYDCIILHLIWLYYFIRIWLVHSTRRSFDSTVCTGTVLVLLLRQRTSWHHLLAWLDWIDQSYGFIDWMNQWLYRYIMSSSIYSTNKTWLQYTLLVTLVIHLQSPISNPRLRNEPNL